MFSSVGWVEILIIVVVGIIVVGPARLPRLI
ncbi:MAG: twin-arginine translocase TatA/TatE family subunit, partial [Corynebacterium sp.]|nr:twin-arginine translocase TatA/TatE family subunit [Corynebacterium sp.]